MRGWSILGRRLSALATLPLSRHAQRRLRERMIPVDEVRCTLMAGAPRSSRFKAIFEGTRVGVVVSPAGNIVTVYVLLPHPDPAWLTQNPGHSRPS